MKCVRDAPYSCLLWIDDFDVNGKLPITDLRIRLTTRRLTRTGDSHLMDLHVLPVVSIIVNMLQEANHGALKCAELKRILN
jgi:hypothetical protein